MTTDYPPPNHKLEVNLSNTALSHSACILNLYRTVVQGYKEPVSNSNLVYGVAVHKYVDTMYNTGGNIVEAVKAAKSAFNIPKNDNRKSMHLSDERHMLTTCMNLWTEYIQNDQHFDVLMLGDKPATELTFRIKFFEDEFIVVYLCGTLDTIGQIRGGCFAIRDWKTTSSWSSDDYFIQYELSRQLRLYTLACKIMSAREPDSTLGKIGATRMGAFIDAIFVKPNANENVVKRSEVYQYDDDQLERFSGMLVTLCEKLSYHVKENKFPKEGIINSSCEGKWSRCSFWNCCKVNDNVAEILLKRDFKQVAFNPLNYNEA